MVQKVMLKSHVAYLSTRQQHAFAPHISLTPDIPEMHRAVQQIAMFHFTLSPLPTPHSLLFYTG